MNKFKYLPNLILIYCGLLLSLSIKELSDNIDFTLKHVRLSNIFQGLNYDSYLIFLCILYFVDDIIENTVFISCHEYSGSIRFYLDFSIASSLYLCILVAGSSQKYFLFALFVAFIFVILWCIYCRRRNTGDKKYLKFNLIMHSYAAAIVFVIFLTFHYDISSIDPKNIVNVIIIFLLWIVFYNSARVIYYERLKEPKDNIEYLTTGLVIRLIFYIYNIIKTVKMRFVKFHHIDDD